MPTDRPSESSSVAPPLVRVEDGDDDPGRNDSKRTDASYASVHSVLATSDSNIVGNESNATTKVRRFWSGITGVTATTSQSNPQYGSTLSDDTSPHLRTEKSAHTGRSNTASNKSDSMSLRSPHTSTMAHGDDQWQRRLQKVMESAAMQFIVVSVIIFDLVFSIISLAKNESSPRGVDIAVLSVLTADIVVRVLSGAKKFFESPLNVFELAVVIVCYVFFFMDSQSPTASARLAGRTFRVFRPMMLVFQQRRRVFSTAQRTMEKKVMRMIDNIMGDIMFVREEHVYCNPMEGRVSVKDSIIKVNQLDDLHLPITCTGGFVEHFHATLPVLDVSKKSNVRIEVGNMLILLGPTAQNWQDWSIDDIRRRKQKLADIIQKRIDLLGYKRMSSRMQRWEAKAKGRIWRQMRGSSYIDIRNLTIRYEDTKSSTRFACGVKLGSLLLKPIPLTLEKKASRSKTADLEAGPARTDEEFGKSKLRTQELNIIRLAAYWDMMPSTLFTELFDRRPNGPAEVFKHYTSCNRWERLKLHVIGEIAPRFPTRPAFRERFDQHHYVVYPVEVVGRLTWSASSKSVPIKLLVKVPDIHITLDSRQLDSCNRVMAGMKEWLMEDDVMCTRPLRSIAEARMGPVPTERTHATRSPDNNHSTGNAGFPMLTRFISSASVRSSQRESIHSNEILDNDDPVGNDVKYDFTVKSWWQHCVRAMQLRLNMAPRNVSSWVKEAVIARVASTYVDLLVQEYFLSRVSKSSQEKNRSRLHNIQVNLPIERIIRLRMVARTRVRELLIMQGQFNDSMDEGFADDLQDLNSVSVSTWQNTTSIRTWRDLQSKFTEVRADVHHAGDSAKSLGSTRAMTRSKESAVEEEPGSDGSSDSSENDTGSHTVDGESSLLSDAWSRSIELEVVVDTLRGSISIHTLWGWILTEVISRIHGREVRRREKELKARRKRNQNNAFALMRGINKSGESEIRQHPAEAAFGKWMPGQCGGFGFEHFGQRIIPRAVFLQVVLSDLRARAHLPPDFIFMPRSGVATAVLSCASASVIEHSAAEVLQNLFQVGQFEDDGQEVCAVMKISSQYDEAEIPHSRNLASGRDGTSSTLFDSSKKTVRISTHPRTQKEKVEFIEPEKGQEDITMHLVLQALKASCYVACVHVAPIKIIYFEPSVEKLFTILRSGKTVSQAQEEFIAVTAARSHIRRKTTVERLAETVMRRLKQRVIFRYMFGGVQVERFQRFSRTKILAISLSLSPLTCSAVWLRSGARFFTSSFEEGLGSINAMLAGPAMHVDIAAIRAKEVHNPFEQAQDRNHPAADASSKFQSVTAEIHEIKQVLGVDVSGTGAAPTDTDDLCDWSAFCGLSERLDSQVVVEDEPLEKAPQADMGSSLTDFLHSSRLRMLEGDLGNVDASVEPQIFIGRRFVRSPSLPQPAPPRARPEFSEACSYWDGALSLWQTLPWQVSVRLVPPSSLGFKIGNASAHGDDYGFLDVHGRRLRRASYGAYGGHKYLTHEASRRRKQQKKIAMLTHSHLEGWRYPSLHEACTARTRSGKMSGSISRYADWLVGKLPTRPRLRPRDVQRFWGITASRHDSQP